MSQTLSIGRLTNRYHLPAGSADADPYRSDLDRLAVREVAPRLEERLQTVLDEVGLGPDTVVVLREIRVRLNLEHASLDPAEIAESWAAAIASGLRAQLSADELAADPRDAGSHRAWIGDDVAVFEDAFAAEAAWLRAAARGRPEAWWWRQVLARHGSAPRAAAVLARWTQRDPARAIAELATLVRTDGARLGRVLTPTGALAVLRALATGRARRMGQLTRRSDTPSSLRLLQPHLLAALTGDDRRALLTAPHVEARRLYALVLCTDRQPSCHIESVRQLDALGDSLAQAHESGAGAPPVPVDATATEGEPAPERDSPPRLTEAEIACGGLLYLIRPLARTELVDPRRPDLDCRLLALGVAVLEIVLSELSAEQRAAAIARELPTLAVFAGWTEVGTDELAEVRGLADAEVAATVARITAALPAQLEPCASSAPAPLPEDPAARRLAWLVRRPGTLAWSATHADLYMKPESIDLALRRSAWDVDPGWVPYLGRIIRFHFLDGRES